MSRNQQSLTISVMVLSTGHISTGFPNWLYPLPRRRKAYDRTRNRTTWKSSVATSGHSRKEETKTRKSYKSIRSWRKRGVGTFFNRQRNADAEQAERQRKQNASDKKLQLAIAREEKACEAWEKKIDAFSYDWWLENKSLSKKPSERLYARLNEHRKKRIQRNAGE